MMSLMKRKRESKWHRHDHIEDMWQSRNLNKDLTIKALLIYLPLLPKTPDRQVSTK